MGGIARPRLKLQKKKKVSEVQGVETGKKKKGGNHSRACQKSNTEGAKGSALEKTAKDFFDTKKKKTRGEQKGKRSLVQAWIAEQRFQEGMKRQGTSGGRRERETIWKGEKKAKEKKRGVKENTIKKAGSKQGKWAQLL